MEPSLPFDQIAPSEEVLDAELSDYLVISQSGEDPFGALFRARHKKLQRLVSIRVLPVRSHDFAGGLADFSNRIARVAQLRHPHLAEISDFGETASGYLYIVSNPGEIAFEPGTVAENPGIAAGFRQILDALSYLHNHGITHGTIHPGSLSIEPASGVRIDGAALAGLVDSFGTRFDPSPIRTFLAPEHSQGFGSSASGDVYSVGVCLYWILTHRLPQGFFDLPSNVSPQAGKTFDQPIIGSLQADPGERINLKAFAALLSNSGQPVRTLTTTPVPDRPRLAAKGPVTARAKPVTDVPQATSTRAKSPAEGSRIPWVFIVVATLGLSLAVFFAARLLRNDEIAAETVRGESPPSASAAGSDTDLIPEPAEPEGLDLAHLAKLSGLLLEIQSLYPHCPNLRALVDRNDGLLALLESTNDLESLIIGSDDPDLVNFVMSRQVMEEVRSICESARLPRPARPARMGTLVGWTASAGSLTEIQKFVSSFTGAAEGIVAVAGKVESGIALTQDGLIVSWGEETNPPGALSGLLQIDCESRTCIALSQDGGAVVWGGSVPPESVKEWKDLVAVSAGRNHVLGVTEDFQVYAAGADDAGQISIPEKVKQSKIFAVEAIGDFSHAVAVDGEYHRWGGGEPTKSDLIYRAKEIHSTGTDLYARSRRGEVFRVDKFGDKSRVDLGADPVTSFLPRSSPDGNLLAYNLGTSRWNLKTQQGKTIDEAYFQEVSRGGIDILVGDERFIGIVPRGVSLSTKPASETIMPVAMTSVEGIPVPEASAFRDWTLSAGQVRRARLIENHDGTRFELEFPDRSKTSVDGSLFTPEDRDFVAGWKSADQVQNSRFQEHLSSIPTEHLLAASGYIRMPMEIEDGNPMLPVTIDGREGTLVADTGATSTLINTRLADMAGIVLSEGPYTLTWQGRLKTFKGNAKVIQIGSAVSLHDVEISATEQSPESFHGLLGIDVMRKVGAVLDFGKSEVYLRREHSEDVAPTVRTPDNYRDWSSRQGTSLRARSLGSPKEGKISLESADGSIKEVKLEQLSEKDLEYLIHREEHLEFEASVRKTMENVDLVEYLDRESPRWDEIKVAMNRNIPEVDVIVDGRTLRFFIDTGAQSTKLSIEAARLLGKDVNTLPVVGRSAGLEGRFLPVFAADFGSFQVGETILHDFRIHVYDFKNMTDNRFAGSPHDGVIGTDLLIQLGAVYHTLENRVRVPLH